jgi:hypothetical protein
MTELTFTTEVSPDSATLEVWSFSVSYAEYDHEATRHAYDWTVTRDNIVLATSAVDWSSKLRSGCSGQYDTPEPLSRMLGTLFSFLSAWAEAWDSVDRDVDSENTDLFPLTLQPMLDRFSSDELALFGFDVEGDR